MTAVEILARVPDGSWFILHDVIPRRKPGVGLQTLLSRGELVRRPIQSGDPRLSIANYEYRRV